VLRDAPPAGQAEIDYGRLGTWAGPATGRRRTVWAFVMVLAGSRHMSVRPTLLLDQHEWTAAHGRRSRSSVAGGLAWWHLSTAGLDASAGSFLAAAFALTVVGAPFSVPPVNLFMWFSRMWT
jgi:hypothetical protein